jgi:hypothetical protein
MANEADDLVLRILCDIRATQDVHTAILEAQSATLQEVKACIEELYKVFTQMLGIAAT